MNFFRKIVGEKCYLSPMDAAGAEFFAEYMNDIATAIPIEAAQMMITAVSEAEWIRSAEKNGFNLFAIVDSATDKAIGSTWLYEIDHVSRKSMFGIFIGDKNFRGKGYAREATGLILDFAFNILNLHSVMLEVFDFNDRAIRLYEKVGFKIIGRRRGCRTVCGKSYDSIHMDLLDREFESPFVARIVRGGK